MNGKYFVGVVAATVIIAVAAGVLNTSRKFL